MFAIRYIIFIITIFFTYQKPILGKYARELTNSNFRSVVSIEKMILVNFYAHWCPHCQRLAPKYEEAAKRLHRLYPSIPIAQIDCAGAGKETCWQYPIRGYPTVRLFRNGQPADHYRGARTVNRIVAFIQQQASKPVSSWTGWGSWSRCSVTCGVGTRNRNRVCIGSDLRKSRYCAGNDAETKSCADKPCVVPASWTGWSSWSGCSVTCGVGTRNRNRVCRGSDLRKSRYCAGNDAETKSCSHKPCVVPASWTGWSSWSGCSVTCGVGTRNRNRVCRGSSSSRSKSCAGNDAETKSCTHKPCVVPASWSGWSSWSRCSVTCGVGTRNRNRVCRGSDLRKSRYCAGNDAETESCTQRPCSDACRKCRCKGNQMDCRYLSLTSVPKDIPSNIEKLDLSSNQITNIPENIFIRNTQMKTLNLGRNRISELPKNVFKPLANIERIYLYRNQISSIHPETFDGLFYLESLQLSNNKLQILPAKLFNDVLGLKYLSLQGNAIASLPDKLFDRVLLLKRLQLYSNKLTSLQSGIFNGLMSLQYLALHKNKLSQLQPGVFNGLSSLERLTLYNNEIIRLDSSLFNGLLKLKSLDIRNNKVSTLPPGLLSSLRTENVRRVNLSNNPLPCSCQLYREIELIKSKVSGKCDGKLKISSMAAEPYCGISPAQRSK